MLFASRLFPLLLQTNDIFFAVREMKYNDFFEVMRTKCVEWQKKIGTIILNCTQLLSW